MKIFKSTAALLLTALIFVATFSSASAKTSPVKADPTPTPVAEVNSFELFWPLSPGKTMTSKVYFLKTLKEDVRGMLIFGQSQKADYNVFLSTKRVLEAQALADAGNLELANKTLDSFNKKLSDGFNTYTKAKSESQTVSTSSENIKKQLMNLETFLKWYSTKVQGETKSKVDQGLLKVQDFLKIL